MKEAKYYQSIGGDKVQCNLCPHCCILGNNAFGLCRSRINIKGKLYSEAYGNLCAMAIDPIEKKPLFHFHPSMKCLSIACTGCNLKCPNCQNFELSQVSPSSVSEYKCTPEQIVDYCLNNKIKAIAYTYTEPLTYIEYMYDIATLAHKHGLYNILVSAGYVNSQPLGDLTNVLDAANIDLKAFNDTIYKQFNRGSLQPVLSTLKRLKDSGIWLEITNLLIPGVTDDTVMLRNMCKWLRHNEFDNTPLHFSRFFPMYRMQNSVTTPIDTLLLAKEIALEEGLKFVYIGNAAEIDGENTLCPVCKSLLIKRNGYRIEENHLQNSNICYKCGATIPGLW